MFSTIETDQVNQTRVVARGYPPVGSPAQLVAIIALKLGESSEDLVGVSRQAMVMRSEFSSSDRFVLFVAGMTTDNGFSKIVAMVGPGTPSGKAALSRFLVELARGEVPQTIRQNFFRRLFELNLPTTLDPGHSTTSLSVNQMNQFARAVCSEVSLASYGLWNMLLCARSAGNLDVRGQPGHATFPSVVGSVLADSVASQSK